MREFRRGRELPVREAEEGPTVEDRARAEALYFLIQQDLKASGLEQADAGLMDAIRRMGKDEKVVVNVLKDGGTTFEVKPREQGDPRGAAIEFQMDGVIEDKWSKEVNWSIDREVGDRRRALQAEESRSQKDQDMDPEVRESMIAEMVEETAEVLKKKDGVDLDKKHVAALLKESMGEGQAVHIVVNDETKAVSYEIQPQISMRDEIADLKVVMDYDGKYEPEIVFSQKGGY